MAVPVAIVPPVAVATTAAADGATFEFNKSTNRVTVKFQVRYQAPKAKKVKLSIVGTLRELGGYDAQEITKTTFLAGLEQMLKNKVEATRSKQVTASEAAVHLIMGHAPINREATEDAVGVNEEMLEKTFKVLESAEEDTQIQDMWSTECVMTYAPGLPFAYSYIVWNVDNGCIWQRSMEIRHRKVPAQNKCSKVCDDKATSYHYVFRDHSIGSLMGDTQGAAANFEDGNDADDYDD